MGTNAMNQKIRLFAIAIGASRDRQDLQRHNTAIAGAILFLPRDGESSLPASPNSSPIDVMICSAAILAYDATEAKLMALEKALQIFPVSDGWSRHCAFATDVTNALAMARELAEATENYIHAEG